MAAALLVAGAPARAAAWCADWTPDDTWLAVAYGVALAADVATSDHLFRNHEEHETNPLLPKHPSRAQLLAAAAVSAAGVGAVACVLDAPWRGHWIAFAFGVEAGMVYRNAGIIARHMGYVSVAARW